MKTKEEIIKELIRPHEVHFSEVNEAFGIKFICRSAVMKLMSDFSDQETAPLKIENGRMSDTINALIRSGSEKDTEISRLKQRLADCERKRLTGERI